MQPICESNHLVMTFAYELQKTMKPSECTYLYEWVNNRMLRGLYIFTKEDVLSLNLPISHQALKNSLTRLFDRGIIMSPWHNFYVIIPTEYKLKGMVPPSFYIDSLMKYLGHDYYVSHLSAAALNGASHQRAMVFQVMISGRQIRSGLKNGTRLEFTLKQELPMSYVNKIKTQMGYMNVSCPELTALDLVADEKKIGGLSRVAEVLIELSHVLIWDNQKLPLLGYFSMPVIQRLGFLLEQIEEMGLADALYSLALSTNRTKRKTWLKQSGEKNTETAIDNRWKIIENYKLELDDI